MSIVPDTTTPTTPVDQPPSVEAIAPTEAKKETGGGMRCTVRLVHLHDGLARLKGAIARRTTLPILSHVHLEARIGETGGGALTLRATNLEIAIEVKLEAGVEREGAVCVPYAELAAIVKPRGRPSATTRAQDRFRRVRLASSPELAGTAGRTLEVEQLTSIATLPTMEAGEYPQLPREVFSPACEVPFPLSAREWRRLTALTAFAAARDDRRPVLTAVFLRLAGEAQGGFALEAVAGDAFRLAHYRTIPRRSTPGGGKGADNEQQSPTGWLVPALTLQTLAACLPDTSVPVRFFAQPNGSSVGFRFPTGEPGNDCCLVSRTIEGTFPNFEQILPRPEDAEVVLSARVEALLIAYQAVAPVAAQASNISRLTVTRGEGAINEDGRVTVSARAEGAGESTQDITNACSCSLFPDSPVTETTVLFNAKYMIEQLAVLARAGVEWVEFRLHPRKPTLIVPAGGSELAYQAVVMPMHPQR